MNRLYNNNNVSNIIDYDRVKSIKARISEIKAEILEGVKVRSRVEEQLKGEIVSTFLIKKQAQIKKKQYLSEIITESNIVDSIDEGVVLNKRDSIEFYVQKYFEKLYGDEPYDESIQDYFVNLISNKINEVDKDTLSREVTEEEIFNAIKGLNVNKAPGIDGIPAEFYLKFWDVIKIELIQVI